MLLNHFVAVVWTPKEFKATIETFRGGANIGQKSNQLHELKWQQVNNQFYCLLQNT